MIKAPDCAGETEIERGLPLELPDWVRGQARTGLAWLVEQVCPRLAPGVSGADWMEVVGSSRVWDGPGKTRIEFNGAEGWCGSEEALLLRLQERVIEAAAQRGGRLLLRGSVVTRGSQALLIVGAPGHEGLAVALSVLDFAPVSIGMAAFEAGRSLAVPLPLLFTLGADERAALSDLGGTLDARLRPITTALLRLEDVAPAPEITHILFLEAHNGLLTSVRPISHTAARARLFDSLLVAPEDPPPFAAIAGLVRHSRPVAVHRGSLPEALDLLARLLPRWQTERPAP